VRRLLPAALLGSALLLFGKGALIYGKAGVAQVLLRRAWASTLRGGGDVKPWPWADTWPVARLRRPGGSEDYIVLAGASGRTLAFGPGQVSGSARPGERGNCVLSAHRDTQFAFLRYLKAGDLLELETPDGARHSYAVYDYGVAHKSQVELLRKTFEPTLTLLTCYPFDSPVPGGPLRYVVRARLSEARRADASGGPGLPTAFRVP